MKSSFTQKSLNSIDEIQADAKSLRQSASHPDGLEAARLNKNA